MFLTHKTLPVPQILKHSFYYLRKGKITTMDKGKNIQMELTEEELQRRSRESLGKFKRPRKKGSELTWPPQFTKLQL